jgi:hypothetical protein
MQSVLKEPFDIVKEVKFKELRSLQFAIGWETEIETCEKVERSMEELIKLYADS